MDFLNRAFLQLRELFESMTLGSRITSALLLVVIVISLGYLFVNGVSGPNEYLMDGASFTPEQLKAMEAAFAKAGLDDYVRDSGKVRIPRNKKVAYLGALVAADAMPSEINDILTDALQSTNPFQTKAQQQGIVAAAKQRMVSQIFASMPGIENAWVMYDSHAKGNLRRDEVKRATVYVKPTGGKELDPALANSIRKVMPWADLDAKNVAVLDLNSGKTFYGDENGGTAAFDHDIERKRTLEQEYRTKIREILAHVQGVTVSCNVELAEERVYREQEIKHDPKPIPQQVMETNRSRSRDGSASNGPPGYLAQGNTPRSLSTSASKPPHEEEEESHRQEYNLVNSIHKEIERVATPIKRVTASIVVPHSWFEKLWSEQNPAEPGKPPKSPTQAELDQIRKVETEKIQLCVAGLLPKPEAGIDPAQLVTVTSFQSPKVDDLPAPPWHESALAWLAQSWTTLAVIGLAFVSLFMLRSMVRMSPAMPPLPTPLLTADTDSGAEEADGKPAKRFTGGGESLLDDLSELVTNDPDTAANILRSWIGNVG
jgi:flagellar M-ring protein FliF